MKRLCAILPLLLLLSYPMIGRAVIVSGLYETEIAVSDQSAWSRKKSVAAALRTVLIKLTGDRHIFARNEVIDLLLNADQYMQQFEYRTLERDSNVLWVRFNKAAVDEFLYRQAIPEWGRERPSTLVWLAVSDTLGRRLVGLDDGMRYLETMDRAAKRRGIALLHPLFDLEDRNQVQISDVWGNFHEIVLAASARYRADLAVTVRLEAVASERWQARWVAHIGNESDSWVTEAAFPADVLSEGVDGLADRLAKRYGQAGDDMHLNETEILVNGITSYDKYAKVLNYLESLNTVGGVAVKEVGKDSVRYVLTVRADIAMISTSINLGRMLEQTDDHSYRLLR